MSSLDGFISQELFPEPELIGVIEHNITVSVEDLLANCPDMAPILLSDGLIVWDEQEQRFQPRVRLALRDRVYELAVRGIVAVQGRGDEMTVRWVG